MAKIDLKKATIKFKDGGSNELVLNIGEGTLTFTESKTMEYALDRGVLDTVREGDEVPVDLSLDVLWEFLSSASADSMPTPREVLLHIGKAASWVTTSDDPCEPFAIDVVVTYTPDCEDVDPETITFPDYRAEKIDGDFKAGTLKTSGKCNTTTVLAVRGSVAS